ncbi:MAG: hypothetical protein ABJO05_05500, partial [Roseibium sp.]
MSKISKRASKYLVARLKRAARLEAFGRAMDAGILESQPLANSEHSGVVWNLVADNAALFSGDVDQDRGLVQSLLKESSRNRKQIERRIESGEFDAFNLDEEDCADETVDASDTSTGNAAGHSDTLPQAGGESALSSNMTSKVNGPMTGKGTATNLPFQDMAALRDHVLSIVAGFAFALKVQEVSAALLLARAIEQDEHAVDRLLSIMKRKKSI